ncbi:MAG: sulfite exporter TauE/SafE family protein [Anaerolineales bacterium]|nr:sulfite exporter TauE/SafE family protein [Anaerolineales bacterium]
MSLLSVSALALMIFAAAILYASVGHAGASAYLAAMALFSLPPELMRPTALTLNILVAAIATVKFYRAGHFSWSLFWPFALASVPLAFLGGMLSLPGWLYKPLVGLVLLYAAYRLLATDSGTTPLPTKPVPLWAGLAAGAGIGLLSGLTGVGGGIFLSPLLLFMNWAEPRPTSGIAAAFILANSTAGLLGQLSSLALLPTAIPLWALAAVTGGWIGAEYGSRRLGNPPIRRLLAVVLIIAGLKMVFT